MRFHVALAYAMLLNLCLCAEWSHKFIMLSLRYQCYYFLGDRQKSFGLTFQTFNAKSV